jgi:hypothetical protein
MPSAYVLFIHMINIFQVPPHIVAGDAILVNTEDDCYIERLVGLLKVQAFDDKNMTLAMLFFGKMILAILLSISPSCIYVVLRFFVVLSFLKKQRVSCILTF